MKNKLLSLLLLCGCFQVESFAVSPIAVQTGGNLPANNITAPLVFGSGETLTIGSGAHLILLSGSTFTLPAANMSTSLDSISSTQGTILYRNGSAWVALAPGTDGYVLATHGAGANPTWAAGGAGGGVTSVGLALPSFITVSNSPVTTSGTLTGTLATQTANTHFAGPAAGGAAQPTFRALVGADIPDLSATYQPLSGNLSAIAGLTSAANKLPYFTGSGAAALASFTPAGFSLTLSANTSVGGTNTGDQTISISGDGTASGSVGALVLAVTKLNGTSLAGLATGILKNTTGTGVPSIAIAGDFPTLNQNTTGSAATLTTPRNINGVAFDGSAPITVTAAAGTLTGATLASNVLASSLTSTGTLTGGATGAGFTVALGTSTITGALGAGNGGTGATSLTAHGVLMGQGASPVSVSTAGTSGAPFLSGGASADGAFGALNLAGGSSLVTGVLPNANIATALSSKTYEGLTITTSTGILTITNGKTLAASNSLTLTGTDGSSVAFGTGGTVLYNGGAGGTPSSITLTNGTGLPLSTGITGFGSGIPAALAINTGTAGAPVLLNGAGGTPSSLTLTNATGAVVAGGGTGVATLTAYAPIFGGTTSTGAVQSGTVGTAGQVLTSNGAGALPTFQASAGGSTAWGSTVGFTTVASATPDITAVTTNGITFSGTTALTGAALGSVTTGRSYLVVLSGGVPLTYNASSMILPGAASITGVSGDQFILTSIGSSQYRVTDYVKADGTPLVIGALVYGTNAGAMTLIDMPVTSAATVGTEESYAIKIDGASVGKWYAESDGAGSVQNTRLQVNGANLLATLSAYGTGTVYTLTNAAAAVALGTTSPSITITAAGTWKISARVQLAYAAATVATETATVKLRRTNNTAADLTSGSTVIDLPTSTLLTYTYGVVELPPVYYTTTNVNDVVTIFANVSATLGAGTITAEAGGTNIVAERLY